MKILHYTRSTETTQIQELKAVGENAHIGSEDERIYLHIGDLWFEIWSSEWGGIRAISAPPHDPLMSGG